MPGTVREPERKIATTKPTKGTKLEGAQARSAGRYLEVHPERRQAQSLAPQGGCQSKKTRLRLRPAAAPRLRIATTTTPMGNLHDSNSSTAVLMLLSRVGLALMLDKLRGGSWLRRRQMAHRDQIASTLPSMLGSPLNPMNSPRNSTADIEVALRRKGTLNPWVPRALAPFNKVRPGPQCGTPDRRSPHQESPLRTLEKALNFKKSPSAAQWPDWSSTQMSWMKWITSGSSTILTFSVSLQLLVRCYKAQKSQILSPERPCIS